MQRLPKIFQNLFLRKLKDERTGGSSNFIFRIFPSIKMGEEDVYSPLGMLKNIAPEVGSKRKIRKISVDSLKQGIILKLRE